MAIITSKNVSAKALGAYLAKKKKSDPQALLEWEMTTLTSPDRGHVWSQKEISEVYSRQIKGNDYGASKVVHLFCHNGREFDSIVVKRHRIDGWLTEHARNPESVQTGNQMIDEINCWLKFAGEPESDLLCPILKYFKAKSDKVAACSEKMQERVIIIAQKAVYVGDCERCCFEAMRFNQSEGYFSDFWEDRLEEMESFSDRMGWRDALYNPGNCGVIFDHAQQRYKAVFIDYAL